MRVQRVVSGDAMRSLARPAAIGRDWVIACLLDTLHRTRDQVMIVWTAHTGQPSGPTERHTWYPGTPLPARTLYVTATATAVP